MSPFRTGCPPGLPRGGATAGVLRGWQDRQGRRGGGGVRAPHAACRGATHHPGPLHALFSALNFPSCPFSLRALQKTHTERGRDPKNEPRWVRGSVSPSSPFSSVPPTFSTVWIDVWGQQESNRWCVASVCRVGVVDEPLSLGTEDLALPGPPWPLLWVPLSLAFPYEVTPLGSHEESGAWVTEGPGPRSPALPPPPWRVLS